MPGHLLRRPEVFCDLQSLANHIARDNPKQAMRLLESAETTFNLLLRFPEMGPLIADERLAASGYRTWRIRGFPHHLIFYRVKESDVEIVRVLHSSQSWQDALAYLPLDEESPEEEGR